MPTAFTCTCAWTLTAVDHETLFHQVREHFDKLHPKLSMTDARLGELLGRAGRDQGGGAAPGTSAIEVKDAPQ